MFQHNVSAGQYPIYKMLYMMRGRTTNVCTCLYISTYMCSYIRWDQVTHNNRGKSYLTPHSTPPPRFSIASCRVQEHQTICITYQLPSPVFITVYFSPRGIITVSDCHGKMTTSKRQRIQYNLAILLVQIGPLSLFLEC